MYPCIAVVAEIKRNRWEKSGNLKLATNEPTVDFKFFAFFEKIENSASCEGGVCSPAGVHCLYFL